jgi:hypothetical protein
MFAPELAGPTGARTTAVTSRRRSTQPCVPTPPSSLVHSKKRDLQSRAHGVGVPPLFPISVILRCRRYIRAAPRSSATHGREELMARTTRVVHTCDLHGDETEATATVLVTSGKKQTELDLCQAHLDALVGAGRKPRPSGPRDGRRQNGARHAATRRRSGTRQTGPSTAAVREWATESGHSVSTRGRIPAHIIAAYTEAHSQENPASS